MRSPWVAYTGGIISRGQPSPFVFDLGGMTAGKSVPMRLADGSTVGTASVDVCGGELHFTAKHTPRFLATAAHEYVPSMGVVIHSTSYVVADEHRMVNGRLREGPLHLVSSFTLAEITLLAPKDEGGA